MPRSEEEESGEEGGVEMRLWWLTRLWSSVAMAMATDRDKLVCGVCRGRRRCDADFGILQAGGPGPFTSGLI